MGSMTQGDEPRLLDLVVGIEATGQREEFDSMGQVMVPAHRYWGAQTQRSLEHFAIGDDTMPLEICRALCLIKMASARVNTRMGRLPQWKAQAIERAALEGMDGQLDEHFPLYVWQTGSGTQTNMNVNEVLSNRAIQLLGGVLGSQKPVGPNDDVNMSQSSNDTFPTAMHLAVVQMCDDRLLPEVQELAQIIERKAVKWMDVVKIGRTHLQDAVPLSVGQEWSGYAAQLRACEADLRAAREGLYPLALGGTAVGTGLNAPAGFSEAVANELASITGKPFVTDPNKFMALASQDAIVRFSASLRGLAVALIKIANDMRWLAAGPRCGLAELQLPENEPGSSIMPGKVNPTQCEALTMACAQVLGNDVAINVGGSSGNFELNVFRPMVAHNFLQSVRLLADGMRSFNDHCAVGIEPNRERIDELVERSLMLVTALNPHIGYDKAATIAKKAHQEGSTLRAAAIASGHLTAQQFDAWVVAKNMVGNL